MPPIAEDIAQLPQELAASLLRALFGVFTPKHGRVGEEQHRPRRPGGLEARHCRHSQRDRAWLLRFGANADKARRDAARDFLRRVDGLSHLPADARALEIDERVRALGVGAPRDDQLL